jgi:predicted RND superfamily exporter protein
MTAESRAPSGSTAPSVQAAEGTPRILPKAHPWAEAYAAWVIRFRWLVILLILTATAVLATQIPKMDVRNDPDTLLPPTNRYVATNDYAEQNFGMGNLMVIALRVREGDIFQPWFINKVQQLHRQMEALPESRPSNFINIAAQKIKYMGADENGLVFQRLIPTGGISLTDAEQAAAELAFLEEGIRSNPVMAPMLVSMVHRDTGENCAFADYPQPFCVATAAYIIADYSDGVKEMYLPWVREVRALVAEHAQDERVEILIAGEPYFLAYMLLDLVQKWWLFLLSLLIVIGVLWFEFRSWRGAIFPMLGVFATIAMTLGLMGLTEFKLTTMMVLTPMLLLAIGVGHSVQITRRFLLEHEGSTDVQQTAQVAISHTIIPATLSIVTDMIGFATLAFVDISFYKDYAYFGMFGMLTLLFTTTTLIPLLMTLFPPKPRGVVKHSRDWEYRMGGTITRLLLGPAKWVPVLLIALVMAVSAYYTRFWEGTAEDPFPGVEKGINYARAAFKESSATWQDLEKLNEIMPGVISVSIPIRGREALTPICVDEGFPEMLYDIEDRQERLQQCRIVEAARGCWDPDPCGAQGIFNDADVLADMEAMENWMREHPFIGFTGSYAQYIRLVNMLLTAEVGEPLDLADLRIPSQAYLHGIDPDDDRDPHEIVQLYNGLLENMTSAGDMDSFVSKDWNEGVILGFINTMHPRETHQVTMDIQQYIEDHKNDPGFSKVHFGLRSGPWTDLSGDTNALSVEGPDYVRPGVGGFLGATEATREVAMTEWLKGPLQTALAIFLVTALMFRSFTIAGVLFLMLMITLFAQYGLGGYFTSVENWSGNLAFHLLVTLSIAMGLGVDYGIYMISRLKEEMLATGQNWSEALRNTLNTTGSAVIVSVFVLLGSFIPLVGTDLANTWGLGMYIGMALILHVFTALMLLPLLIRWLRPRYVFA